MSNYASFRRLVSLVWAAVAMRAATALRTLVGFVRILCLTNREGDIILSEWINSKAGRNLLR